MSLYDEFYDLSIKLGFEDGPTMQRHVFENCELDSQENMVQQFRTALSYQERYVSTYGQIW